MWLVCTKLCNVGNKSYITSSFLILSLYNIFQKDKSLFLDSEIRRYCEWSCSPLSLAKPGFFVCCRNVQSGISQTFSVLLGWGWTANWNGVGAWVPWPLPQVKLVFHSSTWVYFERNLSPLSPGKCVWLHILVPSISPVPSVSPVWLYPPHRNLQLPSLLCQAAEGGGCLPGPLLKKAQTSSSPFCFIFLSPLVQWT